MGARGLAAACCTVVLLAACRGPAVDLPALEERSLSFLDDAVDLAADEVDAAEGALRDGRTDAAVERLAAAHAALADLRSYYLPLLRARELTHLAAHAWARGAADEARALLGRVEEELTPAAGTEQASAELGVILGEIERADVAITAGDPEVSESLAEIERRLNNLALKGALVVRPGGR